MGSQGGDVDDRCVDTKKVNQMTPKPRMIVNLTGRISIVGLQETGRCREILEMYPLSGLQASNRSRLVA
jgi:hypothetical protein